VIVVVATTEAEVASVWARLAEAGAHDARVVAPAAQRRVVLTTMDDEGDAERVAAALRADGVAAVTKPDGGPRLEAWLRHNEPIKFDARLSVCFAWAEHDRRELPGVVELGAGGFGNGAHPSTRLLIEELLTRVTGGERVLDVGCGSGVLGLCALRLGAAHLVAVDMKPEAVAATRRNAALNGMDARVRAMPTPLDDGIGVFDVVLANIGRAALVDLAPQLVRLVAPGAWLAASGFSPSQASLVADCLAPLVELDRRTDGEWSALVMG
jgi:ribosomal protein L11 methyltransferase